MKSIQSSSVFVVVVNNSWYKGYIPFYIYFALRACPKANVVVFLRGSLGKKERKNISFLVSSERFRIIENYKVDYPDDVFTTKSLRWTIQDEYLLTYDYAYIGDIDIMLSLESTPLFDQHLRHAKELMLPYSNVIRPKQKRLTGLHFIVVKEYLNCLRKNDILPYFDSLLKTGQAKQKYSGSNETLLFDMIKKCNLLPKNNAVKPFRPHHGVHLGLFNNVRCQGVDLEYSKDFLRAFNEESKLLQLLEYSDKEIRSIFQRALSFCRKK